MCGCYTVYTGTEYAEMTNIVREVQSKFAGGQQLKTGEIFPTDLVPVITPDGAVSMTWGFPRWDDKGVVINARAETGADKRMFRESLFTRRLVVPSTGFFEWKRVDGKRQKDKYLLRQSDSPMLYMAGLYNKFKDPDSGKQECFVILIKNANASVLPIHDRMPVILNADETKEWLRDGDSADTVFARQGPALLLEKVS